MIISFDLSCRGSKSYSDILRLMGQNVSSFEVEKRIWDLLQMKMPEQQNKNHTHLQIRKSFAC